MVVSREEEFIPVFLTDTSKLFFATVTSLHILKLEDLNLKGTNTVGQFSVYF